jgi:hypothetical protein
MNFEYYINRFQNEEIDIHVPIDKIDGVNVYVFIEKGNDCPHGCQCKKSPMYFVINYVHTERRRERHGIDNQEEFDKMIEKIKNWKFDKLRNKLVVGEQVTAEFYDCLTCPTVKFTFEECSVCLDKTCGKTCCNHPLCLSCFTNLRKPKCPLCRESIYESIDESDEE